MENASKALIIAGAILLSISIIGIGMYVYNQAASAISGANLDAEAIAAFNGKFENYEGLKKGSEAKALCDTIRNHNLAATDDSTKVNINGSIDTTGINTVKNSLGSGYVYTITMVYNETTGYIEGVTIVQN